jgi:hypothetical protein
VLYCTVANVIQGFLRIYFITNKAHIRNLKWYNIDAVAMCNNCINYSLKPFICVAIEVRPLNSGKTVASRKVSFSA